MLKRFWFKFEPSDQVLGLHMGCGVTAFDYEDAVKLLRENIFKGELPNIISCQENVDISTLDQNHVVPNMGVVAVRGIWFPRGY